LAFPFPSGRLAPGERAGKPPQRKPEAMTLRLIAALAVLLQSASALARNIVLTNDDGLTSNIAALYLALKAQGHDVVVSVPCSGQSGMGAAINFTRPLGPLRADCLNGAGKAGEPGAGPVTRPGFERDFYYVDGTPVMALLHGLDVLAMKRWGRAPDLVLSGPNEGQNVGYVVLTSGTVSNAQFAATRGIPAIALSAGENTRDDPGLANPLSPEIARLSAEFVQQLDQRAGTGPVLPPGVALNVNFPDELAGARWKATRIGTFGYYQLGFAENVAKAATPETQASARARGMTLPELPGVTIHRNASEPRPDQANDEAVVIGKNISVSVMQIAYDHDPATWRWLRAYLKGFLAR
jgi:5'-nucleotidase